MARLDQLRARRAQLQEAAQAHGARNLRVFGSVARGTESAESDLDLLVELEDGRSLFDLARLYDAIEEITGLPVDIVTEGGLSPYLRDRVLTEAVPL